MSGRGRARYQRRKQAEDQPMDQQEVQQEIQQEVQYKDQAVINQRNQQHEDALRANSNFAELVINRIDSLEESMNKRMDDMDKKLNTLIGEQEWMRKVQKHDRIFGFIHDSY